MISVKADIKFNAEELKGKLKNGVRLGLKGIARKIHERAVMRCPVGNADNWKNPKLKPKGYVGGGRLRNSLSYSVGVSAADGNEGGGQEAETNAFVEPAKSETQAVVGTRVTYALWVESGTSRTGAQPYLRPAFDEVKPQIESIMSECIIRELSRGA